MAERFVPRKPTCPFFYKYASAEHLDWLRHILLNHEVYFASHPELNDPQDGWAAFKRLRTEQVTGYLARDFIRRHPNADPAFLAHHVATIHRIPRGVGADWLINEMETLLKKATLRNRIYSMSMACESECMWRKYGGAHTGYCLEFANAGLFSLGGEVRYEDELTQFDLNDPDSFFIYRKTSQWREEQEARVVMYPRVPEFLQFFKNGESPFAWFEPTLLQRIILGAKMTMPNREQIRAWALERCPQLLVTESQVAGVAV